MLDERLWPSVCTHPSIFNNAAAGVFCTVMAGGEIPIFTLSFVPDTRSHKGPECSVRSSTCSLAFYQAVN